MPGRNYGRIVEVWKFLPPSKRVEIFVILALGIVRQRIVSLPFLRLLSLAVFIVALVDGLLLPALIALCAYRIASPV